MTLLTAYIFFQNLDHLLLLWPYSTLNPNQKYLYSTCTINSLSHILIIFKKIHKKELEYQNENKRGFA